MHIASRRHTKKAAIPKRFAHIRNDYCSELKSIDNEADGHCAYILHISEGISDLTFVSHSICHTRAADAEEDLSKHTRSLARVLMEK